MILLHWAAPVSPGDPFRSKEKLVVQFVAPVLQLLKVRAACREFYASKQDAEVWLNLFVMPGDEHGVITAARPLAAALGVSDPILNNTDGILCSDCADYRRLLTTATRYAIDLHSHPNLVEEQQALICIACRTADPRTDLKTHLKARSSNYRADWFWTKRRFWHGFHVPGPRPNFSHPGHWIWNIVLGIDYPAFPWPSAASAAAAIGIPAPSC